MGDISEFLGHLSVRATSGLATRSGGAAIDRYRGGPGDAPRVPAAHHVLTMCFGHLARFEGRGEGGRRLLYTKSPGALSLVPAGICPQLRSLADFELVICALDSSLVASAEMELGLRLAEELRVQVNIRDRAMRQLLRLLLEAAEEDGASDRLYMDRLLQALSIRFLALAKETGVNVAAKAPAAALPHRVMRRVEEQMRSLDSDLSLEALAKESGYSRFHFSRMFQAATGHTPHNYVLHLRVDRAQKLLANSELSLTEIALQCGFSSHSHMTRVFHQLVGATPSAYRRFAI